MIKTTTRLKLVSFILASGLISGNQAFAKQVPESDAKKVAENFFSHRASSNAAGDLAYTALDGQGMPLYYVFNMNANSGFVIVSGDDAARPIIGYSTEQGFQKPDSRSATAFWLSKRENEISYLRKNNIPSNTNIASAWSNYLNPQLGSRTSAVTSNTVAPLLLSHWNQSPFYNDSCPGNSVTGCVATTMAQIMRYWSYPNHGTGSSSYCDCTSNGYPNNYGTLHANYANATYNWNNMPYTITTHNAEIAKLMYHCGVSVEMNYDPAGSSAQVISDPVSAQSSYVNYFNYDPTTILGVGRLNYGDAEWLGLLKGDLDIGRPVQYAGFGNQGGHTWVCDGYDASDLFHMNWGWGGAADGFYDIDGLNPAGDDFNNWQQGLFGIVPPPANGEDAAIVSISPMASGCTSAPYSPSIKIRNYGNDQLTSCNLHYKIDNGAYQVTQWTGYLVTGQADDFIIPALSLTNGLHNISCYVSDPNSDTDVNASNDQSSYSFGIYNSGTLPIIEGFETPSQTANDWAIVPAQSGANWAFSSQAYSGGAQSMMVNNLSNTAGNISILQGLHNYNFALNNAPFKFKVAYQQKAATNKDKLALEVSTDCGSTWAVKWSKQGSALVSTTALSSTPYVPAVSDFVPYSIAGVISHNTMFRWVFTADPAAPGNNVYLDDINIGTMATGISQINGSENSFDVYPNPANGEATLKFSLDNASTVSVQVTDLSGRKVIELAPSDYQAGEHLLSVNKNSSLSAGVYLVTVSANGISASRKLIVN